MGLYKDTIVVVRNISNDTQRVLTLDGKADVKKGKTFETTEKEANQLTRLYGYLFKIVDKKEPEEIENIEKNDNENEQNEENTNDDVEKQGEDKNDEGEENTENSENTEAVENTDDDIPEEEKVLIEMRKAYKEKYNQEVPVNKKNDINRIKSKL